MRLFGIGLVAAVPLLFFHWQAMEIRKALRWRKGLLLLIRAMEFQIQHFDREQTEIFSAFGDKALEDLGFLPALRLETKRAPCGAFGRVMADFLPKFSYSAETGEVLLALGEHFGLQAKQDQLRELSEVADLLDGEREQELSDVQNRIKILEMVGLSASLGIWILLI